MKKLAMVLSLALAAGLSYAGETAKADTKAAMKPATHEVQAEIVSVDAEKKTVTLKTEKGESKAPLEGKALARISELKPGQKITAVCRDNETGEHQAVTEIKEPAAAKAPASTETK
jgi:hypothetical protein